MNAVLFDMDGVLLDSETVYVKALSRYLKSLGAAAEEADLLDVVGMKSAEIVRTVVARYSLTVPEQTVMDGQRAAYWSMFACGAVGPMPGFTAFHEKLRREGSKTALVSSSARESIGKILRRFSMEDIFDEIVSGDQVENGKPAPDAFLLAARRLGIRTEDCAVVEDSPNGILAGKRAGMYVVGFKGAELAQDTSAADLQVYGFSELMRTFPFPHGQYHNVGVKP